MFYGISLFDISHNFPRFMCVHKRINKMLSLLICIGVIVDEVLVFTFILCIFLVEGKRGIFY
jgi:hypothetical protein